MLLLDIRQVQKSYGDRTLFEIEQLQAYSGERIGVVGKNGAGKSSLLKLLIGELQADQGTVQVKGDYAYIAQLNEEGLINASLSGGEKTKEKIKEALKPSTEILLADEPTSHLDLEGIKDLEHHFLSYRGLLLLISHDRTLLNRVCTKIWEVDDGRVFVYEGNYEAYQEQKQKKRERQRFEFEQYTKEKKRLEETATAQSERSNSLKKAPSRMGNSEARLHKRAVGTKKAKLNRGVKAIETRINQLEKKDKPRSEEVIHFDLDFFHPIHSKTVVQFQQVAAKVGNKELFNQLTGTIKPGEKVAIVGRNGVGKTTLLQQIYAGSTGISRSQVADLAYFYQQLENLDESLTIIENIQKSSNYPEHFIRAVLARLLFKSEDVHKKVKDLSGGERVKTSLIKVFLSQANVLLLDEPTNFLDLPTKEALAKVLTAYPGTIIFVSHDRFFTNELATDQIVIENGSAYFQSQKQLKERQIGDLEEQKLRVNLEITEIVSKLSIVLDTKEKAKLEVRFQELLTEKKRLG
ncbi:ribosomal protection-like ABC-F family protein [Alkalihalobacillus pseudalcaliphilus]|uniref:ribosomal protection-like ABC-F family protein n=1 Tax=Alkalihalobacillus pseudalcaliphilus TaxID=79884 RepID=UPI00064E12E3|nr:ABC-F family ATP-binding cassette domain-containing protein [Alkalihalobacillus pseudalcaliphilus]KMK76888.1 ABC transporter ATP-binding protein [Alkalihalobacillus pseudalcaliphilus]